jgi:pimeloyl-[acyl-carrier protein] methyl ester esterase
MSLRVETSGSGPDVVLLHGWGMNRSVWSEIAALLAARFRVHALDLPGYGAGDALPLETLDALAYHVAQAAPARCAVCGWSLGGAIALAWAHHAPQQVTRLALIATSPCFVQRSDWPHAVEAQVVHAFSQELARDREATLKRFIALQAQGDVRAVQAARLLRQAVRVQPLPDARTLQQGLALLLASDMRPQLPAIGQPALVVHGDRDALVPLAAAEQLARALPHGRLTVLRGTAHAPFASDPRELAARLVEFFDEP